LDVDPLRGRMADAPASAERAARAIRALIDIAPISSDMFELMRLWTVALTLLPQIAELQDEPAAERLVKTLASTLRDQLSGLATALDGRGVAASAGRERLDLRRYLVADPPALERDVGGNLSSAEGTLNAWAMLLDDLLGDVADVCLDCEAAMKLPALAIPKPGAPTPETGTSRSPAD
jgi:hypothetical protein